MEKCGCRVWVAPGDLDCNHVEYCPLHAAAPEMRDCLKEIYEWTDYKNSPWAKRTEAALAKASKLQEG